MTGRADLGRIRTPSLIVGTRDDLTVPFYQSEDLHKAVAGSKLIVVDEGRALLLPAALAAVERLVEPSSEKTRRAISSSSGR